MTRGIPPPARSAAPCLGADSSSRACAIRNRRARRSSSAARTSATAVAARRHEGSTSGAQTAAARPASGCVSNVPTIRPRRRAIQSPDRSISPRSASSSASAISWGRTTPGTRRYRTPSAAPRSPGGHGRISGVRARHGESDPATPPGPSNPSLARLPDHSRILEPWPGPGGSPDARRLGSNPGLSGKNSNTTRPVPRV